MDIENPMVNDDCWPDYEDEEKEDPWTVFCMKADEEYDDETAYLAEYGWGRANGYTL